MSLGVFYFKIKVIMLLVIMPLAAHYSLSSVTAVALSIIDIIYSVSRIRSSGLKIYASSFLAACIYLIWTVLIFILFDFVGISRLIQAVCITVCFISSCCLESRCIDLRFVRNVIVFQLILFCIWWPISGFVTNYYSAFYGHGNFLGGLLVIYLPFLMLTHQEIGHRKKISYLFLYGIMAFLFLMANNRASYLTVITLLLGCIFIRLGKSQKIKRRGTFLLLAAAVVAIAITVIYPLLLNTALGLKLELMSRLIFNKNFFSGRQVIWKRMEELILQSPYIGYGLDATPSMFYDTEFSCHNYWLQTALQCGLIGALISIIFFTTAIFDSHYKDSKEWYLPICFGAAYIIHECFEVSLTQNNFALGISVWFFFGLMIALKKSRLQRNEKQYGLE